ncbi:hypothetical protein ABOM_000143 [Aspergillus bombycis]|uniref:RING-type domain-containing protein n=1 Tax=Aspergillus bombycis TaxID=109264 RepID=A0A1F8AJ50_9EURO|nr:hypothetical protein ABOM_000143 [Aspergillus bombycis]OGM51338.1 hypothetical protein ABOM_000143 [Aspergillus bombycis]
MAATDQPSGLMDIASSLTQDEIPFKLRCAICNKLAVNAFRLPCCDQAICENCQASLPETCPVCAHTPLSSDLCKPNKALRTTLKAFLRTEEKKREKERQSATPATANDATPVQGNSAHQDTPAVSEVPETKQEEAIPEVVPTVEAPSEELPGSGNPPEVVTEQTDENHEAPVESQPPAEDEQTEAVPTDGTENPEVTLQNGSGEGEDVDDAKLAQESEQDMTQGPGSGQMLPNGMPFGMAPGMFPMGWNNNNGDFHPMSQFMGNGMFNPMGMAGMMDPMVASQGMFGGYGMNMNGMNTGMNFDAGQGIYGGWDGSQNNMWNGGQDKFNPNAFANGMGPQYGAPSGFGGYNMSQPNGVHPQMQQQQFPNQDFQTGYYGPGYGRGNFRGRGRGFYPGGRGRGGYTGPMQANYPPNANYPAFNSPNFNQDMSSQSQEGVSAETPSGEPNGTEATNANDENALSGDLDGTKDPSLNENVADVGDNGEVSSANGPTMDETTGPEDSELRGIPTIDSLDQANAAQAMHNGPMMPMGPGFGRGYMRGPFPGGRGGPFTGPPFMPGSGMPAPRGPGVEGAPAAPRAMREGLPNTSILRQRNFQGPGRGLVSSVRPSDASQSTTPAPQEDRRPRSRSRSKSRARSASRSKSRSRSRARSQSTSRRHNRPRSASIENGAEDSERKRERPRRPRREDKYDEQSQAEDDHRTRSPSVDSRRSSHRRDRERDRRSGRRSHRSHRHRSQSPSRNGDSRDADRLALIPEEKDPGSRSRTPIVSEAQESSSRTYRSGKDRPSRRDEERERDRDSRRRDRERDRDRDRYRERERDRERDRDRARDRHRDRDRDRDRDRKRSRRDRTESPVDSDYSSRYHSRRIKRSREDEIRDKDRTRDKPSSSSAKTSEPEKDPHTLEREARNRERLLKEQQRREAMHADRDAGKTSRRRDSRQERPAAGSRRLTYKYEDDESDAARAARVEKEREASRWA